MVFFFLFNNSNMIAQEPELLNNIWYVDSIIVNNEATQAPRKPEMTLETFFSSNGMSNEMCCAGQMEMQLTFDSNPATFGINNLDIIIENCTDINFNNFRDLYVEFFQDNTNDEFEYNISTQIANFGDYLILTITNPAGAVVTFYNTPHYLQTDHYIFDVYNNDGVWHLTGIVVDETPYPISYDTAHQTSITFSRNGNFHSQICGEIVSKAAFISDENEKFYILCENLDFTPGNCQNTNLTDTEQQYYNFLQSLANGSIATFQTYIADFGDSCSEVNGIDLYDPATNTWVFLADCVDYLSIDSFDQKFITIYPNPTSETLYIDLKNNTQAVKANLYNLEGKLIQTLKLASTQEIDVKNLNMGMYLLVLEDENGNVLNKKFVKK